MRLSSGVWLLATSQPILGFVADIRADSNRDGTVDLQGDSDSQDKRTLSPTWGAIFLADIDDTDRRCSSDLTIDSLDDVLDDCNDSVDDVERSPQYLAPLRTVALPELTDNAVGNITVLDELARSKVRIYSQAQDQDGEWIFVRVDATFTPEELRQGLVLGIDARDTRQPDGWDGKVEVVFAVADGGQSSVDSVWLRVAPVLTHHHAQRAQKLFVSGNETADEKFGPEFNAALKVAVKDAGLEEPVVELEAISRDIWVQDFFEPAYMSMPGPDGPISIRVMLRSVQERKAGRVSFVTLRDTGVGAWQNIELAEGKSCPTRDSYGNLEAIPPYTLGDRSYPAGRIIQGAWEEGGDIPLIRPFLEAQEVQDPILLDTSWLLVGHVDEYIQFLPADNERGWVLLIDDPLWGLKLFRDAEAAGHGSTPSLSRPQDRNQTWPTISEKLEDPNFISDQVFCAERIDGSIQILKVETGITDEDIYRLPALYYEYYREQASTYTEIQTLAADQPLDIVSAANPEGSRKLRRQGSDQPKFQAAAYGPAMINGIVLNEEHVLTPDPWGPIIDEEDIFKRAALDVYNSVGYNVTFLDSWRYHRGNGEIHCGTNTFRETDHPWWR